MANITLLSPVQGALQSVADDEQYRPMLELIRERAPEITRATLNFCKTQSQFMDNMLTVSHLTPVRNVRQILSEMERTRQALGEAYFALSKKDLEIRRKEHNAECTIDPFDCELLVIEIAELKYQREQTMNYVKGAVRKLANYQAQYDSLLAAHNLTDFDEAVFEAEEEKYHICKAFEQGLNAARSHNWVIDEGNQIYFAQIGINGTVAQQEMHKFLMKERQLMEAGDEPTHQMQLEWIYAMADKFKGCSKIFSESKGMKTITTDLALVKTKSVNSL